MSFLIKRNKVYHLCWYQGKKSCPTCKGTKSVAGKTCKRCRGTGEIYIPHKKRLSADRQTALDYKAEFEAKLRRNELGLRDTKKTWPSFVEEYLAYSKANKRPGTVELDKASLDSFTKIINPPSLKQIIPSNIEKWKQERLKTVSAARINMEFSQIRASFTKAVEWNYLIKNPTAGMKKIKVPAKTPRFLNKEEIEKLLDSTNGQLKLIIQTFILTGLRLSELTNLRWENFNWERKTLIIQAFGGFQPKDHQIRTVPLHKDLLNLLFSIKKNDGYVFPNIDGSILNKRTLEKNFQKVIKKAGIDYCRIHDLRHTFASHLALAGVDLMAIKELLGHSSYSTTLIYAHLTQPHLENAVSKLSVMPN